MGLVAHVSFSPLSWSLRPQPTFSRDRGGILRKVFSKLSRSPELVVTALPPHSQPLPIRSPIPTPRIDHTFVGCAMLFCASSLQGPRAEHRRTRTCFARIPRGSRAGRGARESSAALRDAAPAPWSRSGRVTHRSTSEEAGEPEEWLEWRKV